MEKERKFDFEATKEAVRNLLIAMGEEQYEKQTKE